MVYVTLLYAKWCHVCPSAIKLWEDLHSNYDFDYKELDVDSDEGQDVVSEYGIRGVPATIIDGEVTFIGVPDRNKAIKAIT